MPRNQCGTWLALICALGPESGLRHGWGIGGFDALFTFNYTDTYEDAGGERTVDYQTTFDAFVEYRFGTKPL